MATRRQPLGFTKSRSHRTDVDSLLPHEVPLQEGREISGSKISARKSSSVLGSGEANPTGARTERQVNEDTLQINRLPTAAYRIGDGSTVVPNDTPPLDADGSNDGDEGPGPTSEQKAPGMRTLSRPLGGASKESPAPLRAPTPPGGLPARPGSVAARRRPTLPLERPGSSASPRKTKALTLNETASSTRTGAGALSARQPRRSMTGTCNRSGTSDSSPAPGRAATPQTRDRPASRGATFSMPPSSSNFASPQAARKVSMPDVGKVDRIPSAGDDLPTRSLSVRARRPSLIPAGELRRELSFTDETFDEVSAQIKIEEQELDWLEGFWNRVLVGSPAAECKGLAVRSISHWVELFNRWQSLGSWKPGEAPEFLDAYELRDLLAIPMSRALEWVKLLDFANYGRLQLTRSVADHTQVQVSVPALMVCGVFMSTTISKQQKIRFLLGMFDEADSKTMASSQFTEMISCFIFGIAGAFGLLEFPQLVPKPAQRQTLGRGLFDRVLATACCRIPLPEAQKMKLEDSVPHSLIEEWFLGETGDPLAVPFAMLLERHSARRGDDDPESFEEEELKFRLCHTEPVEPPVDTAASLDSSFLRRSDIRILRDLFKLCQEKRDFSICYADAESALETAIDPDLWCNRIARGLEQMEFLRESGQKTNLGSFLKRLCPHAKPRHLRMFHTWTKELDRIEELKMEAANSRRMLSTFESFVQRPILPARVRQELLSEFNGLHQSATEARVMACAMQKKFFRREFGVNKDDYIAAMCPIEFRPKEGNPVIDQVVGELLRLQVKQVEDKLKSKEALFDNSGDLAAARRRFLKLPVGEQEWARWNQAFDAFGSAGAGGRVSITTLVRQHDICPAVCDFMCSLIGGPPPGGGDPGFSKDEFLKTQIKLRPLRVRKETLKEGRLC